MLSVFRYDQRGLIVRYLQPCQDERLIYLGIFIRQVQLFLKLKHVK